MSFMKENSLPLRVVEAVRTRTIKWIRHTMQPGAIARTADSDDPAPNNRDLSFKLKGGTSTRDSPILHARANVDWLTLDTSCATQM